MIIIKQMKIQVAEGVCAKLIVIICIPIDSCNFPMI